MRLATLAKVFATQINHRFASLPYNLNWGVRKSTVAPILSKHPLVVMDIGARGEPLPELSELSGFIRYFGFDADKEECQRLMSNPPANFREFRILPYLLGEERGTVTFNLYNTPGFSSVFEIDEDFNETFLVPPIRLARTISIPGVSLDEVVSAESVDSPDLLKLDTQGSELSILRGGRRTLQDASMVEVEVEFCSMYKDQPLFCDVDKFMREAGFEMLYMCRSFLQRKAHYKGVARGQVIFGDVLYGRSVSEMSEAKWPVERVAKYVIMLCQYGHIDFARHICDVRDDVVKAFPEIVACFPGAPNVVMRGLVSQLDKLTCLLLHCRRTNHVFGDSDRSWPIR